MLKCTFLIALSMGAVAGFCQDVVSGIVFCAQDRRPLEGAHILVGDTGEGVVADERGAFSILLFWDEQELKITYPGYQELRYVLQPGETGLKLFLEPIPNTLDTIVTFDPETYEEPLQIVSSERLSRDPDAVDFEWNTEDYSPIFENNEKKTLQEPLSTFSIDVDRASYANVRRFIESGAMPPKDAVRIEEMINYFDYDYQQPTGREPFSVHTELSDCPWNAGRKLLHIGLKGKKVERKDLPPSNLVFLIDVSGSMDEPDKLPLLKEAFRLLVEQLQPEDRVAIVTYAGKAGLALPSTPGAEKEKILLAINQLAAGGSTAGGEGIQLAYRIAKEHLMEKGNNRVILGTDGDFNIGASSDAELMRLIEEKRQEGVYLTVLGFGTGNIKDNKMELLADKGNGNYAYIDNLQEARKVLVAELSGTLFVIAKDVKIQVEFNPQLVRSYRLVGYENRALNREDFSDDRKDAGELGVGHTVTALYELELGPPDVPGVLRYQQASFTKKALKSGEIATLSLRYKEPEKEASRLLQQPIPFADKPLASVSDNFRFAAAVAGFGLLLRQSEYNQGLDIAKVIELAEGAQGKDAEGFRAGFLELAGKWKGIGGKD